MEKRNTCEQLGLSGVVWLLAPRKSVFWLARAANSTAAWAVFIKQQDSSCWSVAGSFFFLISKIN